MKSKIEHCFLSTLNCDSFWGCRFLTSLPSPDESDESLFSRVYGDAKRLGLLDCPRFIPSKIDLKIDEIRTKTNLS